MNANKDEKEQSDEGEGLGATSVELNPIVAELARRLRDCSGGTDLLQRFLESKVHPSLELPVLATIDEPDVIAKIALILHLELERGWLDRRKDTLLRKLIDEEKSLHAILCRLLSLPETTNLFIDWRRGVIQQIRPKVE